MKDLELILGVKRRPIRVIYVSSYIPRKCGIATYTKDLTNAINLLNPYALAEIMAVNRPREDLNYPWETKFKINQEELTSYLQAADYINHSGADIVSLQHEFGLFGSHLGENIIPFVESLKRPLVTTLHTVFVEPNSSGGVIIKRLIEKSKVSIVMMEKIKNELIQKYGLKNKREIWKVKSFVSKLRRRAKELIREDKSEQEKFFEKLNKKGLGVFGIADVLALNEENILNRRLQTFVFKKKLFIVKFKFINYAITPGFH